MEHDYPAFHEFGIEKGDILRLFSHF